MTKTFLESVSIADTKLPKDLIIWNYWDHEHLDVIHKGYKESDILYDSNNFIFRVDKVKIPVVPFFASLSILGVCADFNSVKSL